MMVDIKDVLDVLEQAEFNVNEDQTRFGNSQLMEAQLEVLADIKKELKNRFKY